LSIFLTSLFNFLIKKIANRVAMDFNCVKSRWRLTIVDFFMTYTRIAAGIGAGIQRIIRMILFHLFSFCRID
jgi:hypothetical protein